MKLEAFQCPVCLSTHFKVDGDNYICLSCGNSYTKKQADSQMFIDLRIANSYRQFADFSKAKAMYEEIIAKYPDEDLSPAYWGLLLCDQQVMIEVDGNGQLFPSFYRVKEQSIRSSPVYKRFYNYVMNNSQEKLSTYAKRLSLIEDAREKAIVISKNTKPYDVFICFKKTKMDSDIVTKEYDLANEIYNELSDRYRIFFSEKSLRGIKVREYEPNIYFGLHTAKVMLLICSKREYLESHWVQNEWKRFLEINKNGKVGSKCIIPIFTDDFTPDDLPPELIHLQGLKYGISLLSDIEKELDAIIHPVDKDELQQKQIDQLIEKQNQIIAELVNSKKTEISSIDYSRESKETVNNAVESLIKLAKVNIEDLGNFDEAFEIIHKAQEIDAEYYLTWYYKLLIDFKAQTMLNLVMHENYKESINYRLLVKYAKSDEGKHFVEKIENTRNDYLKKTAGKVNAMLVSLDNNPHPTNEDINEIKLVYESLDSDAKKLVENLKDIILRTKQRIKDNRVNDFNSMLNVVENKEHPNYDDLIKIKENYAKLSEEEQLKAGNYRQVVVNASNKMKQGKAQIVQQALIELDNKDIPQRDEIIKVEKKYNALEDEYKQYVIDYASIMSRAYDKKYRNDAKVLKEYLTKLPTEKVANREIFTKLQNRYMALPRKYREMVTNSENLTAYEEKLIRQEEGPIKRPEIVNNTNDSDNKTKKKSWFWNKG